MNHNSALKKRMVLEFVTYHMDLEVSMLSEISQTQQLMFKCLQTSGVAQRDILSRRPRDG